MAHRKGFYERFIKRPQDFILSLVALIVLSPVFLVLAILVRVKLGSPVIFKQQRPGLKDKRTGKEKIFTLYKFRSMTDACDKDGNPLPDDVRLTQFGKVLRSTSLDELPELVNILKGDMAIVGPRPLLVKDLVFMSDGIRQRHTVRPGLTGFAQVKGRNGIAWDEKFQYDLEYVDNVSFLNDVRIVFMTAKSVVRREGITEEGCETATDYGDWLLSKGMISEADYSSMMNVSKGKRLEV